MNGGPVTAAGYVLAGGRSTRMGCDKALLTLRGARLIELIAAEVRDAAGSATLVGCTSIGGFRGIPDLYPGFGPLGAIVTALADSPADWILVVACDMPAVQRSLLSELLHRAVRSDSQAVVPVTSDGRLHPLCAAYHRSSIQALQRCVEEDIHTVRDGLNRLRMSTFPLQDEHFVANVNTPEEWAAFTALEE